MIGMVLNRVLLALLPLRGTGCYISRASYVRAGEQSLDGLYKPYHLVVYYRFLRFFPDGESLGSFPYIVVGTHLSHEGAHLPGFSCDEEALVIL